MNINTSFSPNAYSRSYSAQAQYSISHPNSEAASAVGANKLSKAAEFNDPEVRQLKRTGQIECETCKTRKYQDGSNDPGVSFKTPGHIDPDVSASAVMSHEKEHVTRESAKAESEGRKVVAQSVKLDASVCPECGKSYISGGTTTTTTKGDDKQNKDYFMENMKKSMNNFFGKTIDLKV